MRKTLDLYTMIQSMYLVIVAIYILKFSFSTTLYYIPWPEHLENILRFLTCVIVFIKLGLGRTHLGKNELFCILSSILLVCAWQATGYTFLLDTVLLIAGSINVPWRKVLIVCFWTGLLVLAVAILGSCTGCIPDYVYSDGTRFRHSFGIIYPTDFSAHITFLVLVGWVLYGGNSFLMSGICVGGLAFFTYYFCRAKCSTIVMCFTVLSMIYYFVTRKYSPKNKVISHMTKRIDNALIYIMPVCALLIICLTLLYDQEAGTFTRLNNLLNGRLKLGRNAINNYGISLFGTTFEQIGFGGGPAWSWTYKYNFVDSSYVLILIRYGAMTLMSILIWHIGMGRKALKYGQRRLVLAIALVSLHSMIEHHLPELYYNSFLLLPFADFAYSESEEQRDTPKSFYNAFTRAVSIVFCMGIILVIPTIIEHLKTLVDIFQWDKKERNIYFLLVALFLFLCGTFSLYFLKRTINILIFNLLQKTLNRQECVRFSQNSYKVTLLGLLLSMPLILLSFLWSRQVIRQNQAKFVALIHADSKYIFSLLANDRAIGNLYIDPIPEIYRQNYSGISRMILAPNGYGYHENSTLITDNDNELHVLMDAGYEYGEISPWHSVYTNSIEAKNILQKAGIALTDYYSKEETVNLYDIASLNHLKMTKHGTLLLEGESASLTRGTGITIYQGMLRVAYQLRVVENTMGSDQVVTAMITSDWGARLWDKTEFGLDDLNENGELFCEIDVNLKFDSPNTEFLLLVPEGIKLEVVEIRYGKIG